MRDFFLLRNNPKALRQTQLQPFTFSARGGRPTTCSRRNMMTTNIKTAIIVEYFTAFIACMLYRLYIYQSPATSYYFHTISAVYQNDLDSNINWFGIRSVEK
ncbi:hypothetical protein [Flavobacterium sp. ACAM 123]|uniref:hypothetical protein n=1 Tax=Flavobacterium sp. ACAM 123 TaxID=1189620 RepID=UPI0012F9FBFC|nr:hypothetical protein [Flavobacterium sp. ACAM 123]